MTGPRVFVTTDIGGSDKDDDQAMVHLLLYADKLRIEGIGSSAAATLPESTGRAADINQVIDAYAKDYANLITYSEDYPTADYLHSIVSQGSVGPAPIAGYSKPNATSQAIIAAARAGSAADPLYVLTWGSIGDVAQALHDAPDIADKIRIVAIGYQDPNAGRYMLDNWKGKVWWIDSQTTFRGMYAPESGTNTPIVGWSAANAAGHGALGDYFEANTHDLYGKFDGSQSTNGLKMGDTPTVLYLIDSANNNDPTADSWGGQFVQKDTNYWTDDKASSLAFGNWYGARTVAEHRDAFLADFSARLNRAKAANAGAGSASTPDASAPPSPPASGDILVGTTEVETLSLSGFTVEHHGAASAGQWVKTASSGTASGSFGGPAGLYQITVSYLDESDGVSPMSLAVNGRVVKSWSASVNDDKLHGQSVQVSLNTGDTISIKGVANVGEYSRIDQITIGAVEPGAAVAPPATDSAPPTPLPPSPPASGHILVGTTEVETLSLSGFTVEQHGAASAGQWVKTASSGTASGSFDGPAGLYQITVSYMDESDGVSPMSLAVNGRVVKSWSASVNDDKLHGQSVQVSLNTGDMISIKGAANVGEYSRIDQITIGAVEPGAAVAPPATGSAPVGSGIMNTANFDLFAFAGQSNAAGHFFVRSGDSSGGPLGKNVFQAELSKALGGPVTAINVAVSGSASNQYANNQLYWWDIAANKPSTLLVNATKTLIAAEAGGKTLDGLIWAQGEDDARLAYGSQKNLVIDRMTQSTQQVFAYIRAQLGRPDLPIFIQEIGSLSDVPADRYDAARAAQARIIAADPFTFLGAGTTDLNKHAADRVHFSNAEYDVVAKRLAATVAQTLTADTTSNVSLDPTNKDTLVLRLSEDMFKGHAQFTASVDGKGLGAPQLVTALHNLGQTQAFAFTSDFGTGAHDLAVTFLNDAYEGSSATDRNLFVDSVELNGKHFAGVAASLYSAGTWHFQFTLP